MSKHDSPFTYGEFWLDKRRDGRTPNVWQIAFNRGRSVAYRSTGCSDIEKAKKCLIAHATAAASKLPTTADEALVFTTFKLFWNEHGQNVVSPGQVESSLRVFMGFLIGQRDLGAKTTVSDLNAAVFERFRKWRMAEHTWQVIWNGENYIRASKPVKGETVQRNLDDVKAALRHAQRERGIIAPHVPPVPKQMRSPPRDRVLSIKELGAIFGYSHSFPSFNAWLSLMLATAARPEAALAFNPAEQVRGSVIDLHPHGWARTKKVNPVVPAIPEIAAMFDVWPAAGVSSRKTAWRTMRRVIGLSDDAFPKTIRHTVATMLLDDSDVTPIHIEALLGHRVFNSTSAVYAKWDVRHLEPVRPALSRIWHEVHDAAHKWRAVHSLSTGVRGDKRKLV